MPQVKQVTMRKRSAGEVKQLCKVELLKNLQYVIKSCMNGRESLVPSEAWMCESRGDQETKQNQNNSHWSGQFVLL